MFTTPNNRVPRRSPLGIVANQVERRYCGKCLSMSVSPVSGLYLPFTARTDLPLGFVEYGEDRPEMVIRLYTKSIKTIIDCFCASESMHIPRQAPACCRQSATAGCAGRGQSRQPQAENSATCGRSARRSPVP